MHFEKADALVAVTTGLTDVDMGVGLITLGALQVVGQLSTSSTNYLHQGPPNNLPREFQDAARSSSQPSLNEENPHTTTSALLGGRSEESTATQEAFNDHIYPVHRPAG